jgi:hypothetical protein
LISLLYILSVWYQQQTARLDYKVWDVDTVTAADFTVETFFTVRMWQRFLEKQEAKKETSSAGKIRLFEDHLRKEVEEMVR